MESLFRGVLIVVFWGLQIASAIAGFLGIEAYAGLFTASVALAAAVMFKFTLPFVLGAFYYGVKVAGLPWYLSLFLALPGLLTLVIFLTPAALYFLLEKFKPRYGSGGESGEVVFFRNHESEGCLHKVLGVFRAFLSFVKFVVKVSLVSFVLVMIPVVVVNEINSGKIRGVVDDFIQENFPENGKVRGYSVKPSNGGAELVSRVPEFVNKRHEALSYCIRSEWRVQGASLRRSSFVSNIGDDYLGIILRNHYGKCSRLSFDGVSRKRIEVVIDPYKDLFMKDGALAFDRVSNVVGRDMYSNDFDDPSSVKFVQRVLMSLGYYSGEVNGRLDETTRGSIDKYRRDRVLMNEVGIDYKLLDSLESDLSDGSGWQ